MDSQPHFYLRSKLIIDSAGETEWFAFRQLNEATQSLISSDGSKEKIGKSFFQEHLSGYPVNSYPLVSQVVPPPSSIDNAVVSCHKAYESSSELHVKYVNQASKTSKRLIDMYSSSEIALLSLKALIPDLIIADSKEMSIQSSTSHLLSFIARCLEENQITKALFACDAIEVLGRQHDIDQDQIAWLLFYKGKALLKLGKTSHAVDLLNEASLLATRLELSQLGIKVSITLAWHKISLGLFDECMLVFQELKALPISLTSQSVSYLTLSRTIYTLTWLSENPKLELQPMVNWQSEKTRVVAALDSITIHKTHVTTLQANGWIIDPIDAVKELILLSPVSAVWLDRSGITLKPREDLAELLAAASLDISHPVGFSIDIVFSHEEAAAFLSNHEIIRLLVLLSNDAQFCLSIPANLINAQPPSFRRLTFIDNPATAYEVTCLKRYHNIAVESVDPKSLVHLYQLGNPDLSICFSIVFVIRNALNNADEILALKRVADALLSANEYAFEIIIVVCDPIFDFDEYINSSSRLLGSKLSIVYSSIPSLFPVLLDEAIALCRGGHILFLDESILPVSLQSITSMLKWTEINRGIKQIVSGLVLTDRRTVNSAGLQLRLSPDYKSNSDVTLSIKNVGYGMSLDDFYSHSIYSVQRSALNGELLLIDKSLLLKYNIRDSKVNSLAAFGIYITSMACEDGIFGVVDYNAVFYRRIKTALSSANAILSDILDLDSHIPLYRILALQEIEF